MITDRLFSNFRIGLVQRFQSSGSYNRVEQRCRFRPGVYQELDLDFVSFEALLLHHFFHAPAADFPAVVLNFAFVKNFVAALAVKSEIFP